MLAPSEHSSAAPAATASAQPPISESDKEPVTQPAQEEREQEQLPPPPDLIGESDRKSQKEEIVSTSLPQQGICDSDQNATGHEEEDAESPISCSSNKGGDNESEKEIHVELKVEEGEVDPDCANKDVGTLISVEGGDLVGASTPSPTIPGATGETPETASVKVIDCDGKGDVEIRVTPPSGGGICEVVEILNNLESLKTPELDEVENGTVRASFVHFDLSGGEEGPLEEQSDSEEEDATEKAIQAVGENSEEISDNNTAQLITELGMPNPELQKIREEQVRQWLIFEQENPPSGGREEEENHNEGESMSSGSIEADSLAENGTAGQILLQNGHHEEEGDASPQTNGEDEEMTMNGVDGMPRRVRFLTDQEGNLLISVFMSNTPTAQLSDDPSSILSNGGGEEGIAEGEHQNPSLVVSPPSMDTATTEPSLELDGITEASDFVIMEPTGPTKEPPQEKPPEPPTQEEDDGGNSSDETLSVSSCNSMIEILPGKVDNCNTLVEALVEPDVILDENNNEVKSTATDSSTEANMSMASVTACFQLNGELNHHHITGSIEEVTEEETASDASSSQPPSFIVHEPVGHSEGQAALNNPQETESGSPPTIHKLPNIDENNNVEEAPLRPQFHPDSPQMPELRQGTWSSSDDGDDERMSPPGEIPPTPLRPNQAFIQGVLGSSAEEQEQQMVSLCIQEEHISAVALTIAKWESMSKAQSTENLSAAVSPISGHAPVSKTSSSPCPTRAHKPVMQTLSAKPIQPMPPQSPIQIQQVIIHASAVTLPTTAKDTPSTETKKEPVNNPSSKATQSNQAKRTVCALNVVNNAHSPPTAEPIIVGKVPGWNCWGNKINDVHPQNKTESSKDGGSGNGADEEIIYAQPNHQAGSTMTSIANPSAILKSYPKPLSKNEIMMWLKDGEIQRAGLMMTYGQAHHHLPQAIMHGANNSSPVLANWFFGLISRQQAERYLHGQPSGTFLVRISTRIWGYTLSYQASSGRTKHFLISATNPSVPATLQAMTDSAPLPPQTGKQQRMSPFLPQGKYAFIGTNMTPYGSLISLIRHHSHAPITKLGGEKLISSCPGGPQVAGMEALFK